MNPRVHGDMGKTRASVMLAAWPGIGSVGIGAIDYIRRKLDAQLVADLDMRSYFTAEGVVVEDGLTRSFSQIPTHMFYAAPEAGLILSQSEAQVGGKAGVEVMTAVLDVAEQAGVQTVYTAAALPMTISCSHEPSVAVVANRGELLTSLLSFDMEALQHGHVSGMNGLLLGFAGARQVAAACLMGAVPQYAASLPNPKATREIVHRFRRILGINVNMDEIDAAVEEMDATMSDIEEKIRTAFAEAGEEAELPEPIGEDDVPQYVMERVERLFREVSRNKSKDKAAELKLELDRWNLYSLYEDRFLNLFR